MGGQKDYSTPNTPRVKFMSHQLEMNGAQIIFVDLVLDFRMQHPQVPIEFHTYHPAHPINVKRLKEARIDLVIHGSRDEPPTFSQGDVVVLNTTAYSPSVRSAIYDNLSDGKLKKAIWYIHEDWPETHFTQMENKVIKHLLAEDKISIFIPAIRTTKNYRAFLGNDEGIHVLPYRMNLPPKFNGVKQPKQFRKIIFAMTGQPADLKGTLPMLYAFLLFKMLHYDKNPKAYRDFEFRIIGLDRDSFTSEQVRRYSATLGRHFKSYPPISHEEALDLIKESNITISYSMRECLPISVFEGMFAGHPILRNDTSGREEQLEDGKNGILLDSNSLEAVAKTIEKVLNINKTSERRLAEMSKASYEIAAKQQNNTYEPLFQELIHSAST